MSSNSTSTPTASNNLDLQQKRQDLKQQLSAQLLYYFSTKNLTNDVYLQTIMKLNSGHVPVSILSNFSNVNKIIGRSGLLPFLLNDHDHDHSHDGYDDNQVHGHENDSNIFDSNGIGGENNDASSGGESGVNNNTTTTTTNNNKDGGNHRAERRGNVDTLSTTSSAATNKSKNIVYNDYTVQIHNLLREAALECNLLSLVTLDQNGNVVNDDVNTDVDNRDTHADTDTDADVATSSTCTKSKETERIIRRFDAIGPSSDFDGIVPDENILNVGFVGEGENDSSNNITESGTGTDAKGEQRNKKESVANINETSSSSSSSDDATNNASSIPSSTSSGVPSPSSNSNSNHNKNGKTNIIILRDVHEDATEKDIRKVFDGSNQILNVVQEFGNCWFVTLDMEEDTKQDVITTMLGLRQKTICNEPIKARLKTQSVSSSVTSGVNNSTTGNDKNGSSDKVNDGNKSYYHNGRNPYHRDGVRNKTSSTGGHHSHYSNNTAVPKNGSIYSGDRVNFINSNSNNVKKSSRGYYINGGGSASYNGSQNYHQQQRRGDGKGRNNGTARRSDKEGDKGRKAQKNLSPPPPVVEEHYPSLAGGGAVPSSPTSIVHLKHSSDKAVPSSTDGTRSSNITGGYAAALLKDAPPSLPPTSAKNTSATNAKPLKTATAAKAVTNMPSPSSKSPKKNANRSSFHSGKATVMTASIDDSSSDDKSSLSSKPELESFIGAAAVASPTSTPAAAVWGSGRSFADVLKE